METSIREHLARVEGRRLNYIDVGSGEPVLLLHGIGGNWHQWERVVPLLASRRRVIAVDMPGFGKSDRPPGMLSAMAMSSSLQAFMRQSGHRRYAVVGHSLGALVALQLAGDAPRTVTGAGLVSCGLQGVLALYRVPTSFRPLDLAAHSLSAGRYFGQIAGAAAPLPRRLVRALVRNPSTRRVALSPYLYDPDGLDPALLQRVLAGMGRRASLLAAVAAATFSLDVVLGALPGPPQLCVVVNGDHDALSPSADAALIAARAHDAEFVEITEAGHWLPLEKPEECAHALDTFLTRCQLHPVAL